MRWWWVLAAGVMGSALAQESGKGMSDAERAKRDAEKVFSFIKFQPVKKPAPAAATAVPRTGSNRAEAPAPSRGKAVPVESSAAPMPAQASAPPSAPLQAQAGAAEAERSQASAPSAQINPPEVQPPASAAAAAPSLPSAASAPDSELDEPEVELKLVDFVAPELSPQVQATLGASNPVVKLRFTVGADGKVEAARAVDGVPRRLGQVAERAVLQWRFEPLPAAREVEVEIAFRR